MGCIVAKLLSHRIDKQLFTQIRHNPADGSFGQLNYSFFN
jgi:hypothetical protein